MEEQKNKKSEIEVIDKPQFEGRTVLAVDPIPLKDPEVAAMVTRLARVGLNRTAVAIAARITPNELSKYYIDDFNAGQASMQEVVATAAMEQVMAGNPQMIQFMAKTKLGWNETNVIEHIGEVRAVVSAVPLTKEEFAERYLKNDTEE